MKRKLVSDVRQMEMTLQPLKMVTGVVPATTPPMPKSIYENLFKVKIIWKEQNERKSLVACVYLC